MKNVKHNVFQLLNSYSKHYQTRFKLIINNTEYFSNFNQENEASIFKFTMNNIEARLICAKENFSEQLNLISIALCEMMKEEDVDHLFEKGLKGLLSVDEKESIIHAFQTNQYTICLIETKNESEHLYEILKSIVSYPMVQLIHNKKVALLIPNQMDDTLMMELKDTLEAECYCRVYCSCSALCELNHLDLGYEEASIYLQLIKKYEGVFNFSNQKDCFFPYLIECIEEDKAKKLLSKMNCFNQMDDELFNTIQIFLRNNLSIAETARQLYLHRNTLIYRLDKIMNLTGLDIRNFDEAVKMEITLLLKKRFT